MKPSEGRNGYVFWTVVAVSLLATVLLATWLVIALGNRAARKEIFQARDILLANIAFDIEGIAEGSEHLRPTPTDVRAMLGRLPDGPIDGEADRAIEQYTFKGLSQSYMLYIVYKRHKASNQLRVAKAKLVGELF